MAKIVIEVPEGELCGKCKLMHEEENYAICRAFSDVRLPLREGDGAVLKCRACLAAEEKGNVDYGEPSFTNCKDNCLECLCVSCRKKSTTLGMFCCQPGSRTERLAACGSYWATASAGEKKGKHAR